MSLSAAFASVVFNIRTYYSYLKIQLWNSLSFKNTVIYCNGFGFPKFSKNLNIITGETGAGKSILMGALSLILGDRADSSVLQQKEKNGIKKSAPNTHFAYGEWKQICFLPVISLL